MSSQSAIAALRAYGDPHPVTYPANHAIARQDASPSHAFIIESGLIMQCRYGASGERQVCRVFRPGEVFGLEAVIDPGHPPVNETLTTSVVIRIALPVLRTAMNTDATLQQAITELLAREVIDGNNWKTNLGGGSSTARACRFLLWIARGNRCVLPPREKLGSILSVTTETASRIIADLRRQNLLERDKTNRDLARINRAALEQMAGDFWDRDAA